VRRIDALFEIERSINGKSAQERLEVRQRAAAEIRLWPTDIEKRLLTAS